MSRLDATVVPPPQAGAFAPGPRAPDPVAPAVQEASRSYGYDRLFFRRLWQLSRPYWTRPGALGSWLVLGFLLVTVVAYSACGAWIAVLTKSQTDALMNHHPGAFWRLLVAVAGLTFLRAGISALQTVVDGTLDLHWHQWMAQHLLVRYFSRRHYYKLVQDERLENADQRLQEELSPFCTMMSSFPRLGLGTLIDALVQLGVLLSISGRLFWVIGLFSLLKFGLLVWVYTPVIRQNYDVTEAEGHYRASIRHVMVNAETVAFYRGEGPERRRITGHLQRAVRYRLARTLYATRINLLQGGLSTVWLVLPLLVLAPQFFAGEIKYGTIAESVAAVALLLQSLSLFMQFIPTISLVSHKVARIGEINELFDTIDAAGIQPADLRPEPTAPVAVDSYGALIVQQTGEMVRLERVSLSTPGGEHRLVQNLDLVVPPGERWLIRGPTGVGKSSLLRAMAGLWTRGSGRLTMPPPDDVMFLPQRPYLIPGTLREQLYYPNLVGTDSDFVLQGVLAAACLPQLTAQYGGFDTVQDWARVLSLGEQQRLALARVLLAQPRYLFLDEATSAVDLDTERRLYLALAATGVTYVSVGHRPSLGAYHDAELQLLPDGAWTVASVPPGRTD